MTNYFAVDIIEVQKAITAFGGRSSFMEPGLDTLESSKGHSAHGHRTRWKLKGALCPSAQNRLQQETRKHGGWKGSLWGLTVPCGIQPADPHFEQRKASPQLWTSWLGLELGEQKAQTPGLCRRTQEVGTAFRCTILDSGRWVERPHSCCRAPGYTPPWPFSSVIFIGCPLA